MNGRCLIFVSIATAVPLSAQIGVLSPSGIFGFGSSITGAPYSATQTTERIQTLADGTHITQPGQKTVTYRDSGRPAHEQSSHSPYLQVRVVNPRPFG